MAFERLLLEDGTSAFLLEDDASYLLLETSTGARPSTSQYPGPAGRSKSKRQRKRRVLIGDQAYDVLDRDIPTLIESFLMSRRPPKTAEPVEVEEPAEVERTEPVEAADHVEAAIAQPSAEELQARADALRQQLQHQAEAELVAILDRVAMRLVMEAIEEEEAVVALLLH